MNKEAFKCNHFNKEYLIQQGLSRIDNFQDKIKHNKKIKYISKEK